MECLKIMTISAMVFMYGSMDLLHRKILCVILFCIFSGGADLIAWSLKCCGKIEKSGSRVWNFILFEMILRKRDYWFAGNGR